MGAMGVMNTANGPIRFGAIAFLSCNLALAMTQPAASFQLALNLANRTLVCEGGSESRGVDYRFNMQSSQVDRIDGRFPDSRVVFRLGSGQRGKLQNQWSYETLSQKNGRHVMLYERLSLRSSVQNQHIYRTYELFSQGKQVYVTIYDGVNGARDWKMKVTRKCHPPGLERRNYATRKMPSKYWNPQN